MTTAILIPSDAFFKKARETEAILFSLAKLLGIPMSMRTPYKKRQQLTMELIAKIKRLAEEAATK